MSHTAAALVRFGTGRDAGWSGADVDLSEIDDVDALVDALDEVIEEAALLVDEDPETAGPVLIFVEEDDEWLGVLRVDDGEVRVFLSDRRVALTSEVAERFFSDAAGVEIVDDADLEALDVLGEEGTPEVSDDPSAPAAMESERPEIEPGGDIDLMVDLGVPAETLLKLSTAEGVLPSDVIATLAEAAGAGTALEELRGG